MNESHHSDNAPKLTNMSNCSRLITRKIRLINDDDESSLKITHPNQSFIDTPFLRDFYYRRKIICPGPWIPHLTIIVQFGWKPGIGWSWDRSVRFGPPFLKICPGPWFPHFDHDRTISGYWWQIFDFDDIFCMSVPDASVKR